MKIAVSSTGTEPSSNVDLRFGRAPFFLIFDSESEDFEVISNEENSQMAQGVGIQAAQLMASKGVQILISGKVGPKAYSALKMAGIEPVTFQGGTVSEAVEMARDGKLPKLSGPNAGGHGRPM